MKTESGKLIVLDEEGYFRLLEANNGIYDTVLSKTRAASKEEAKELFMDRGFIL